MATHGRSTNLDETAYRRLRTDPTAAELKDHFSPSPAELRFVQEVTRGARDPLHRVFLLLHLKTFQRLGYFLSPERIPQPICLHLARALGMRGVVPASELRRYSGSDAEAAHRKRIRERENVRPLDADGWTWLRSLAEQHATTRHFVVDIINVMIEELLRLRYELPGFSRLDRLAIEARERVHQACYVKVLASLSAGARELIDGLLRTRGGEVYSGWHLLKREPKRPTHSEVRSYLQHIARLKDLAAQLPPIALPARKLEHFRAQAAASDASEMAEFKPAKRYTLAAVFIRSRYAGVLDDAADLFGKLMRNIQNTAEEARLQYQQDHAAQTDQLIVGYREVLTASQKQGSLRRRVKAILDALPTDVDAEVNRCDEHLTHSGTNYQPFVLTPYARSRPLLLDCLAVMGLQSSSSDATLVRLIGVVLAQRHARPRDSLDPAALGIDVKSDLAWLPQSWRDYVLVKRDGDVRLHRAYLELAVLTQVENDLKSGDLFIPDGERYDDYREQLVDDATLDKELVSFGEQAGFSADAERFVADLKQRLTEEAERVDQRIPKNPNASITAAGRLKLGRPPRRPVPSKAVRDLDAQIRARMPQTGILDVLLDATRWLELPKLFRHVSGTRSRLDMPELRVVTSLACYGCLLGPTQTARSIRGLTRKQIAWLNLKYVDEKSLQRAIEKATNKYNEYELPSYWGNGKTVSADGTKWALHPENPIAEYRIKYGGYGGMAYYHVSDKYIALISHFHPCGVYEGAHILDVLMNQSDIQPDTIHGDTHAQSFPIFGLAYVLGFELMPRIRGVTDLPLFAPDRRSRYDSLQSLFRGTVDWKLIQTHFRDIMRIAISIKLGKLTPSSILRRLGTYSRSNKVSRALRELGRALRTIFLLKYFDSLDLRKVIHAATNKNEAYNQFVKTLGFGNGGVIQENLRHEQLKVIRYNHLVASLVILHNIEHMSRILEELRTEGIEISEALLGQLGPFRLEHLNLLGDYAIDVERPVTPPNPLRAILQRQAQVADGQSAADDRGTVH